ERKDGQVWAAAGGLPRLTGVGPVPGDERLSGLAAQLEARVKAEMVPDGSHDIGHLRRVCRTALNIAAEEGGDPEILVAAAYLHDLVNLPKDHPDRALASTRSAQAARAHLIALGFTLAQQDAIAHAIAAHSFSAGITPETLEARILQDADRLDALGAIGVARCFYVAGQMRSALFDAEDPQALHRAPDDTRFALDHFETKLYPVAEALLTPAARRIAATRVTRMRGYVDALLSEIDPNQINF
ncbi:MAG: HD domain-containing protein, partial [Pseudomonadota bacterium]